MKKKFISLKKDIEDQREEIKTMMDKETQLLQHIETLESMRTISLSLFLTLSLSLSLFLSLSLRVLRYVMFWMRSIGESPFVPRVCFSCRRASACYVLFATIACSRGNCAVFVVSHVFVSHLRTL